MVGRFEMNQKTILALAALLALTIVIVSGFYFFSAKSRVQKPVQTATSVSDIPASEAAASEGIPAAEVDGIDVEELIAGSKGSSSAQHEPELLSFEFDKNLKSVDTLLSILPYTDLPEFEQIYLINSMLDIEDEVGCPVQNIFNNLC